MRSTVLIFVALGCGGVASLGAYQYLRAASNKDDMKTVLVASKEININEALNKDNVKLVQWPGRQVPSGSLSELAQVENKYARIRLYEGEPILSAKVMKWDDASSSLKVPKGFRAVSVKVTMESSVSSLIEPGDHVDVVVVVKKSQEAASMAKTILKAVQVFAVNNEMAKSPDKEKALEDVRAVCLLLDPEQAEKLAMAQELGVIRLALRSPGDDSVDETRGCTLDRLLGRGDVAGSDDESEPESEGLLGAAARAAKAMLAPESVPVPSPAQVAWTTIIDSPKRTEEYRYESSGQPRLVEVIDKSAPSKGPAAQPEIEIPIPNIQLPDAAAGQPEIPADLGI